MGTQHMPEIVNLEITARCNLRCVFCKIENPIIQSRGDMPVEMFISVVDQVKSSCNRINLWGNGEPLLHPRFFEMAGYLTDTNISRIKVSTNGHFLDQDTIDRLLATRITEIRIPVESSDSNNYTKLRRDGNLSKVLQGIEKLIVSRNKYGSSLKVTICTVYTSQSFDELASIRDLVASLGVDEYEIMPNMWKRKLVDVNWVDPRERCQQPLRSFIVLANGDVIPCCYTVKGEVVLGNVNHARVADIWNGEPASQIRQQFVEGTFPFCNRCSYGATLVRESSMTFSRST